MKPEDNRCRNSIRIIPRDDQSLQNAIAALDEALDTGNIEEIERLDALLAAMSRVRCDNKEQ